MTLANNAHERDIRHTLVPYPALYPSFQENLDRFRQREQEKLHQRGAEQVFRNAELYNTRRSSEDGNTLVEHHREDAPVEGPQEQQVEEENRAEPSQEHIEETTHQPDDNKTSHHNTSEAKHARHSILGQNVTRGPSMTRCPTCS